MSASCLVNVLETLMLLCHIRRFSARFGALLGAQLRHWRSTVAGSHATSVRPLFSVVGLLFRDPVVSESASWD
jgi:hypothetical protein